MKHLLSFLLAVTAVPALAGDTVAITPPDIADVHALEEVIVAGDRNSLSSASKAIEDAEDRLYARFNELNDADAFDIVCRVEAPTGTLLEKRVCEPKGVQEWTRAEASTVLFSAGGDVHVAAAGTMGATLMAESKSRMSQLIQKDPELMRALLEHARLAKHFEELKKKKLEGHSVVWD